MEKLLEYGGEVFYNDPYVPELCVGGQQLKSVEIESVEAGKADMCIIVTDHSCYNYDLVLKQFSVIF